MTTPDPIFSEPRLAAVYDAFDGDRTDLPHYMALADELKAHSVVDIGCGTGEFALRLAATGRRVIGVDPAEASINVAKTKPQADTVQWIVGDATAVEVTNADIVTMTGNVAQAIVDPEVWKATLSKAFEVLNSGGHLVFETRKPEMQAWKEWTKVASFQSISVPEVGLVDSWVELTDVQLPLVNFCWTFFFHSDSSTLVSDSTLRFRTSEEVVEDLRSCGYTDIDIREAPDRPGKEFVFVAQTPS